VDTITHLKNESKGVQQEEVKQNHHNYDIVEVSAFCYPEFLMMVLRDDKQGGAYNLLLIGSGNMKLAHN